MQQPLLPRQQHQAPRGLFQKHKRSLWRPPQAVRRRKLQPVAAVTVPRWLSNPAENRPVLALSASTFLLSVSHTALRPVLPLFAKSFGVGAAAVGGCISIFAVARLLCNLPAGHFADEYGRKPLLVLGPLITALGFLGCGMSRNFSTLLAFRFLTGIGSSLQMAGAQLFLADISTVSNRARVFGIHQAANLMGSLGGPVLGGVLAESFSLRTPFVAIACASALAGLYGALCLKETAPARKQLVEQPCQPSSVSPALPTQQNSAAEEQTGRDFAAVAVINSLIFMTMNGSRGILVPLLATQKFGLTPSLVGLLFSSQAVISLCLTWPASWAADELGRKWTIVPSCCGLAAALLLACLSGTPFLFLAAMVLFAAGNACLGATPSAYAADLMRESSCAGVGLGIYRTFGDLGLMLGPVALGYVAECFSVQFALGVNAVCLLAATIYFTLAAREPSRQVVPV